MRSKRQLLLIVWLTSQIRTDEKSPFSSQHYGALGAQLRMRSEMEKPTRYGFSGPARDIEGREQGSDATYRLKESQRWQFRPLAPLVAKRKGGPDILDCIFRGTGHTRKLHGAKR